MPLCPQINDLHSNTFVHQALHLNSCQEIFGVNTRIWPGTKITPHRSYVRGSEKSMVHIVEPGYLLQQHSAEDGQALQMTPELQSRSLWGEFWWRARDKQETLLCFRKQSRISRQAMHS